jgi:hypothetical protein
VEADVHWGGDAYAIEPLTDDQPFYFCVGIIDALTVCVVVYRIHAPSSPCPDFRFTIARRKQRTLPKLPSMVYVQCHAVVDMPSALTLLLTLFPLHRKPSSQPSTRNNTPGGLLSLQLVLYSKICARHVCGID